MQAGATNGIETINRVKIADMDGDGDLDIVANAYGADNTGGNGVLAWFENDGDESFTSVTIASVPTDPKGLYSVDLDGDSDMDVLSCAEINVSRPL